MAGITAYGAYVPMLRLALGKKGGPEKAVANWDEDAVTMAVAAEIDALRGVDRATVDAVHFASTSYPFKEKQGGIVIGGMITGFFSPTESGTIGTVAVFVLALVRREVTSGMILRSFKGALRTSIMVLMLIAGSSIFGHFLAITEIPMIAAKWAGGLPIPGAFLMLLICCVYLIGGSIMDDLAFMVLATPIFFPTAIELGYDPIWFDILICVTLMICGLIPPVAIYVFILGNITGIPFKTIYKGVIPFLSARR